MNNFPAHLDRSWPNDCRHSTSARAGFTLLEVMVAFGVLSIAMILVVQLATSSLSEKSHSESQLEAIEAAANVLEEAQARPWRELTPDWAKQQHLSDSVAKRLNGQLLVKVKREDNQNLVKRVTAEVRWPGAPGHPDRTVILVGLFAERTTGGGS